MRSSVWFALAVFSYSAVLSAESEQLRIVVRVAHPAQQELVERIRGHVTELPVEIVVRPADGTSQVLDDLLLDATRMAAQSKARVVVWLVPEESMGGTVYLYFALPDRRDRLLIRPLPVEGGTSYSFLLESAAMVVRTAVRSLVEGMVLGEPVGEDPADERESSQEGTAPRAPVESAGAMGWAGAVGWHGARDGMSPLAMGVGALGEVTFGRLGLGLAGIYGVPSWVEDEWARVRISRNAVGLRASFRIPVGSFFFTAAGQAGAAGFWRSTHSKSDRLIPSDSDVTMSPWFVPEVGVSWLPTLGAARVGVGLRGGCEYMPGAPSLLYEWDDGFLVNDSRDIPRLQPFVWVGLVAQSF